MQRRVPASLPTAFALGLIALAPKAAAGFGHEWKITEVYSNSSGSVQYIEMFVNSSGENLLSFMFLESVGSARFFNFPSNLSGSTQNRHLLVATAALASQPGAVTPDYVMPDNFIRIGGDTLGFWNVPLDIPGLPYNTPQLWDSFAFGSGGPSLPTDGIQSLQRAFGSAAILSAPNSPTNFAGAVGSLVPEPASALLLAAGLGGLALQRTRRRV